MICKSKIVSLALCGVAVASLSACGGGGGSDEGPQNTITKFDVVPSLVAVTRAGDSVPMRATAETFGPKVQSMGWSSAAASGQTRGSLSIVDADCAQGQFSSREVPGSSSLKVGTGQCTTSALVPMDAAGTFTVTARVTAADGTQRTQHFGVTVLPRPETEFYLTARATTDASINSPIRLVADPVFEHAMPTTATISYEWSVVSGSATLSGPVTEREVLTVLPSPGKYIFLCTAKVTNGAEVVTRSVATSLSVGEGVAASALGFNMDAQANQPVIAVGSAANLVASYSVAPGVAIDSVQYKWQQMSGQSAMSSDDQSSIYVVPSAHGALVYLVEVTVKAGAITETKSKLVTVTTH